MLKEFLFQNSDMDKEACKAEIKELKERLSQQQMEVREAKLPVVVIVDGWDSAGKGGLINRLISEVDPRFYTVFTTGSLGPDAERYPLLYPYLQKLPEAGKFLFMDGSWMEATVRDRVTCKLNEDQFISRVESINELERTLRDNGYEVIKLFTHITQKTQKKRIQALLDSKNTAWRVTDGDLWQNRNYDHFLDCFNEYLEHNQTVFPWHILNAEDKFELCLKALRLITQQVEAAVERGCVDGAPTEKAFPMTQPPRLEDADLSASISEEEYEEQLAYYQKKIKKLHNAIYRRRVPVIVCFEGCDAAGKGGAIRRLARPLDPRGFDVFPIASPEPHEKARHYLWRFWTRLPRSGHVAIFDRTWYGRVLVERVEGFCSENSWKRAYTEINEFEKMLTDEGAVILKFWVQIDADTQLERFNLRQSTPSKQWKITEEDWRNREKWDDYQKATSEMLEKTSTEYAPWYIVESVDKRYARIKVLRIVAEAMEKALDEAKKAAD